MNIGGEEGEVDCIGRRGNGGWEKEGVVVAVLENGKEIEVAKDGRMEREIRGESGDRERRRK